MANYLYQGLCYADPLSVYRSMAADCLPHTTDGRAISCTTTETGYTITVTDGITPHTVEVTPTLIDCIPDMATAYDLGWMIGGVLIAVGCVGFMIKALK